MTLITLTAVATGGAIGALGRYGVSTLFTHAAHRGELPLATLTVNVAGTLLLAALAALAFDERGLSQTANLFLGTGLCGALTTFSTFSVEAVTLARAGHLGTAALYVGLNLVLCFAVAALAFGLLYRPAGG